MSYQEIGAVVGLDLISHTIIRGIRGGYVAGLFSPPQEVIPQKVGGVMGRDMISQTIIQGLRITAVGGNRIMMRPLVTSLAPNTITPWAKVLPREDKDA